MNALYDNNYRHFSGHKGCKNGRLMTRHPKNATKLLHFNLLPKKSSHFLIKTA